MIYRLLILMVTIFIMQMIRFFTITNILKVDNTINIFIPNINLSMFKSNVVMWCKYSIY